MKRQEKIKKDGVDLFLLDERIIREASIEIIWTIGEGSKKLRSFLRARRARLYGFRSAVKVDRGGIAANITHEVRKHVQFHARLP